MHRASHKKTSSFPASWFPIQTEDLPAPLQSGGQIYAEVIDYERTLYTPSIYSQPQNEIPRLTPTPLSPIRDYVEEAEGSFAHHAQYGTAFPSPLFGNQGSPIDTSGYLDVLRRKARLASQRSPPRFGRHICILSLCLALELLMVVLLAISLSNANAQFGIVPYDGIGTNSYNLFRFVPTAVSTTIALCIETAYLLFNNIKTIHPLARPRKGIHTFWASFLTSCLVLAVVALSSILFQPFVEPSSTPILWFWAIKPQVATVLVSLYCILLGMNLWMLYRMVNLKKRLYDPDHQADIRSPKLPANTRFFRFGLKMSAIEIVPFLAFFIIFHFTTPDFRPTLTVESPDSTSIRPADAIYTVLPLLLALWIPICRAPISWAFFPDERLRPRQKLVLFVNTFSAWTIPVLAGGLFSVQFSSIQQQVVVRPDMPVFVLLLTLVTFHFAFALIYYGRSLLRSTRLFRPKETAIMCLFESNL